MRTRLTCHANAYKKRTMAPRIASVACYENESAHPFLSRRAMGWLGALEAQTALGQLPWQRIMMKAILECGVQAAWLARRAELR